MRRRTREERRCSSPPGIPEARFLTNGKLLARAFNPNRRFFSATVRARARAIYDPFPSPAKSFDGYRPTRVLGRDQRIAGTSTDASRRKGNIEIDDRRISSKENTNFHLYPPRRGFSASVKSYTPTHTHTRIVTGSSKSRYKRKRK